MEDYLMFFPHFNPLFLNTIDNKKKIDLNDFGKTYFIQNDMYKMFREFKKLKFQSYVVSPS